jgi:AcrR family transcriptional regulator
MQPRPLAKAPRALRPELAPMSGPKERRIKVRWQTHRFSSMAFSFPRRLELKTLSQLSRGVSGLDKFRASVLFNCLVSQMSRATESPEHVPSKRRKRAVDSRAAILRAAERIFADAGLGGARTDAIAAQAGVNKALLYYYFKSKDELYYAILEDHLKAFHRRVMDVLSGGGSARAKLLAYVSVHFDFISARPNYPRLFHRLMMTGGKPLERVAREFSAPVYRKLAAIIEDGIRSGELRKVDGQHAALSVVALIVFYFSAAPVFKVVTNTDPYDQAHLVRRKQEVLKFIRFALFKNAGSVGS